MFPEGMDQFRSEGMSQSESDFFHTKWESWLESGQFRLEAVFRLGSEKLQYVYRVYKVYSNEKRNSNQSFRLEKYAS